MKKLKTLKTLNRNPDPVRERFWITMLILILITTTLIIPKVCFGMTAKSKMRIVGFNAGHVHLVNSEGERFEIYSDIEDLEVNQIVIVRMVIRWDAKTNRFQLLDMWIFGEREDVFSR